jgi:hypothetical protein
LTARVDKRIQEVSNFRVRPEAARGRPTIGRPPRTGAQPKGRWRSVQW